MRVLLIVLAVLLSFRPALARDLPDGEFLLVGDVFPAIQEGIMVPVLAHVKTDGDRIDWTFYTTFPPSEELCELIDKCTRFVRSLSHRVAWQDDGTLQILDTRRLRDQGLTVDRPEIDTPHIYGALDTLLDGATLTLTPDGGSLIRTGRRTGTRRVDFLPATLDQTVDIMSLVLLFNVSLKQLDDCVHRQILGFAADPAPTPPQAEVLAAVRYAGAMERALWRPDPVRKPADTPENSAEDKAAWLRTAAYRVALAFPGKAVTEALTAGAPLPDEDVLALARDALESLRRQDEAAFEGLSQELLVDRRAELLAAIRLSARFLASMQRGEDSVTVLCQDVTLGG